MLVSTKGRYALRVMIDLAEHQSAGLIPLKVIAQRQEISEKYLESIIKLLVKAGFLSGLRGKGGGYRLTRAPEEYTVGAILRLTEESLAPVACMEPEAACPRAEVCPTLSMRQGLRRHRELGSFELPCLSEKYPAEGPNKDRALEAAFLSAVCFYSGQSSRRAPTYVRLL